MTRICRSLIAVLAMWPLLAPADQLALRPDRPDVYVVVRGDTLWDISGRFLEKPWRWPELWGVNPQIANPHLIYPGDRLRLVMTADGPRLVRDGAASGPGSLGPKVHATPLDTAIPAIPLKHIRAFLEEAVVLHSNQKSDFAYVASAADEHLAVGGGDRVYGRNTPAQAGEALDIFRIGDAYRDPDTGENLGFNALYIGQATVQRSGDPATLGVTKSRREVLAGDVMIPADDSLLQAAYTPRAAQGVRGRIIGVIDGVSQIGQHSVVVLSRGKRDGLELGHVLQVNQVPSPVDDPVTRERVQPPSDPAGTVMVFRLFDRVSYALVMNATQPMHLLDEVSAP